MTERSGNFSTRRRARKVALFHVRTVTQKYLLAALAGISLLVGFLIPLPLPAPRVAVAPQQNRYELAQEQCVLIRNADRYQGSGFVISCQGTLFCWTANHVVKSVNDTKVVQLIRGFGAHRVGEISFDAKVIARDEKSDLAILWLPHAPANYFHPIHFSSDAIPRVGSQVHHVGNFLGATLDRSVSQGIISQVGVVHPFWKTVDQVELTAAFGSSGGPVFDESGSVLGLIVGGPPRFSGVAFFVPARAVYDFAREKNLMWAVSGTSAPADVELERLAKAAEVTSE